LPAPIVYAVTQTRDGAIWAATAAGVARFHSGEVTLFDRARGALPHDWVTSLLPRGDGVLAGTYDAGVARLHADGSADPLPAFGPAWINPNGLATVGNAIIAATLGDGLLVVTGSSARSLGPLPSNDVTSVVVHRGRMWVGTRAGLAVFRAAG